LFSLSSFLHVVEQDCSRLNKFRVALHKFLLYISAVSSLKTTVGKHEYLFHNLPNTVGKDDYPGGYTREFISHKEQTGVVSGKIYLTIRTRHSFPLFPTY
jgi:hypothetical protein